MPGSDLPDDPADPISVDAWLHRWPTAARKAELLRGVLVCSGEFDHRDAEIAQRAYPGRQVLINESGGLEVHPASDDPPGTVYER